MKRITVIFITGLIGIALGIALAGGLNLGIKAVASTEEQQSNEGLELSYPNPAEPSQKEQSVNSGLTYYRNYAGLDYIPDDSGLTYASAGALGINAVSTDWQYNSFVLPLDLPNGSQVTRIDFYVIDQGPGTVALYLNRYEPNVSYLPTGIASVSSSGSSPDVQTISITGNPIVTINNLQYIYTIRYLPTISVPGTALIGTQVQYTFMNNFLPSILK